MSIAAQQPAPRRRGTRSAPLGRRLAAIVLLLLALLASTAAAASRAYLGLTLAEALADLQRQGLRIIYSSDLVRDEMRVVQEPSASWHHEVLEQLLAPHGLAARVGPGGSLLVVRAGPAPVLVRLLAPGPGEVTVGEVEVSAEVESQDPVAWVDFFVNGWPAARVHRPPFTATVLIPEGPPSCRITAVASSSRGGRGSATVTTRRVVHEDRLEVALRQIFVDVSRAGRPLALERTDFRVFENGVEQAVASFERGTAPLSTLLLIDASESMRGERLVAAFDAARAFLDRLRPEDEAAVMVFADRVLALTPFGPPEPSLLAGVEGTLAAGGTALTDHLYAALRLLDERPGRRTVVLLSDGADVLSVLSTEDLLWKVRRSDASIYWLRLQSKGDAWSFSSAWRDPAANRAEGEGLLAAVAESGGRVEPLRGVAELQAGFTRLVNELRQQYVLGYYPRDIRHDGRWRPVEVRVLRPGTHLRYRTGWVDQP
jgi:Ca-activated chloride channel family protein